MARRPRKLQFDPRRNPTLHCPSSCVRRAFLLGRDPVTGIDHSWRRAWAVRRLKQLARIFAIDVDTYAILENHLHLLLTLRRDLAAAWAAEEVVERWLTLAATTLDEDDRDRMRRHLLARPKVVESLRARLCHPADFHKFLKQPLAVAANREDGVWGPFWAGRYGCFRVDDEAHRLAVARYIDLNAVRAGLADTPEGSVGCGIRDRIMVLRHAEANRERERHRRQQRRRGRVKDDPRRRPRSKRAEQRERAEQARRDEVAAIVDKRPEDVAHAEDGIWLTPIEPRGEQRGLFSGISVKEYLELVDTGGRTAKAGKRGRIPEHLAPILDRLRIDPERFEKAVPKRHRRLIGSIHGGPEACREEAARLDRRSVRPVLDVQRRVPQESTEPRPTPTPADSLVRVRIATSPAEPNARTVEPATGDPPAGGARSDERATLRPPKRSGPDDAGGATSRGDEARTDRPSRPAKGASKAKAKRPPRKRTRRGRADDAGRKRDGHQDPFSDPFD